MKVLALVLLSSTLMAPAAFAQGAPGETGGAAGSIGGTQAATTTAPGGSNGDASTPAPAGLPERNGNPGFPEASRSAPGGTTTPAGMSR